MKTIIFSLSVFWVSALCQDIKLVYFFLTHPFTQNTLL